MRGPQFSLPPSSSTQLPCFLQPQALATPLPPSKYQLEEDKFLCWTLRDQVKYSVSPLSWCSHWACGDLTCTTSWASSVAGRGRWPYTKETRSFQFLCMLVRNGTSKQPFNSSICSTSSLLEFLGPKTEPLPQQAGLDHWAQTHQLKRQPQFKKQRKKT